MAMALRSITFILCALLAFGILPATAQNAGVGFSSALSIDKVVGDEVIFTLYAKDKTGDLIRGWNNTGTDVTLTVTNSGANTDTEPLTVTVIKDINGNPLQQSGANVFIVPKGLFIDGVAQIVFMTTKADTGILITATPAVAGIKNVSEAMNYSAGPIDNFLVELIPALAPNTVYVFRRYEIRVTPRDRYNNLQANETIVTRFTARYPGEFINRQLGSADIFAGEVFIQGVQDYFVISSQARVDQSITAYKSADPNIRGTTGPYIIAEHAPAKFSLLSPPDNTEIFIDSAAQSQQLAWQSAPDPYTNISVGGQIYSDEVLYTWTGASLSGVPLVSYGSNNFSKDIKLTLSGSQMTDIITKTTGLPNSATTTILWNVDATDGLFTTRSTETWRLTLTKRGITAAGAEKAPFTFQLGQNFPNPFNPSTEISFEIPQNDFVSLKVYDLLGTEVATLLNRNMEAGAHSILFEAKSIPSGIYIYKLKAGAHTATRKMTVLK